MLRAPDKATFVALVTESEAPWPTNFAHDAMLDRQSRSLLDEDEMPAGFNIGLGFDGMIGCLADSDGAWVESRQYC